MQSSGLASRVDKEGGFSEEPAFLDFKGTCLFTVCYLPAGPPRAGLVICCPMLVEHMTNYRNEVLLARAVAREGIAVQRFHYRGTGHSEGDESEVSVESMVEDAVFAAGRLRDRTGATPLAFMGTRWGALVAAEAARPDTPAPLLFWEPVTDGARYFRELIRGRLVRELKDSRFAVPSSDAWRGELTAKGWIDILGYALHRRLYDSGQGRQLDETVAGCRAPVLVVQFGRGNTSRPDYLRLKERVERNGGKTEIRFVRDEPAWLFPGHRMEAADTLVRLSTDWLVAAVGDGVRP
jgi:pimeloyl-ACP methyl ester carboxylesterase